MSPCTSNSSLNPQIFAVFVTESSLCATFKVLRRARTRCSLSLSRGSLALWVKQRRSSCLLQGLGSPRAVRLACSKARYSCSRPSNGSGSRPSDTRRSLPSDTLLSLLSTLNSRRSETARRRPVRVRFRTYTGVLNTNTGEILLHKMTYCSELLLSDTVSSHCQIGNEMLFQLFQVISLNLCVLFFLDPNHY